MTRLTYGVAIAVPEPHGTLLREMRASFGDQLARTVPSHVTLLPPHEVEDHELDEICARLDKAAGDMPGFRMRLRGTDTFRPVSPVVYVSVNAGYVATAVLAGQLRLAIGAPRAEFPFHPHVTVAHHLDDPALDHADATLRDFHCEFEVEEFALYLHDDDRRLAAAAQLLPGAERSLALTSDSASSPHGRERREELVAEREGGQLQARPSDERGRSPGATPASRASCCEAAAGYPSPSRAPPRGRDRPRRTGAPRSSRRPRRRDAARSRRRGTPRASLRAGRSPRGT